MNTIPLEGKYYDQALEVLKESDLFGRLKLDNIKEVMKYCELISYDDKETIIKTGKVSDSFFVIVQGYAKTFIELEKKGQMMEIRILQKADIFGEIGLLLDKKRSATVIADNKVLVLRFIKKILPQAIEKIPGFSRALSETMAHRLFNLSEKFPMPVMEKKLDSLEKEAISYLPGSFIIRHRALPLKVKDNIITIGFVDYPESSVIRSIEQFLPGFEIKSIKISKDVFDRELKSSLVFDEKDTKKKGRSYKLNDLLDRMITEGASDLHLPARQKPCWRIDGRIIPLKDSQDLASGEAYDLLAPILTEKQKSDFNESYNIDFAYSGDNNNRFRINLYKDNNGANAAIRMVPANVLRFDQLGLPTSLTRLCDYPSGIVLVTGATGSGKSTTLACLINYINENYNKHIITLEDPIEYVHESKQCLVNQREIGQHVRSFKEGLRSGLREDPDVLLVGEMRDYETISLALEASNTGHLVFATLHTPTAISTIERIIQVFPSEQQNKIRSLLADNIRGIVCQTLCRQKKGGLIPALEVLVVNTAIANMIREGKFNQIQSAMQTAKTLGNIMLNDSLASLVKRKRITEEEALSHSVDKIDLKKKF